MNKKTLVLVLMLAAQLYCALARAQEWVSVVVDLTGKVSTATTRTSRPEPVDLLQSLMRGAVIALESGARATLFYPSGAVAFELSGPGSYAVEQDGVRPLRGAASPLRMQLNKAFRAIKINRHSLAPAGQVMRDAGASDLPVLVGPSGVLLSANDVVFRWKALADVRQYRFQLAKKTQGVLFEVVTEGSAFRLPAEIHLEPGQAYLWRAVEGSAPSDVMNRWLEFAIAAPDLQALAQSIEQNDKPLSGAEQRLREILLRQKMAESSATTPPL
ncbi:MAG TPA: hypothetical protein VFB54_05360 [Burkholderiales bacterium]|nr:hypothetical protein [Burkholderiales bacterium]